MSNTVMPNASNEILSLEMTPIEIHYSFNTPNCLRLVVGLKTLTTIGEKTPAFEKLFFPQQNQMTLIYQLPKSISLIRRLEEMCPRLSWIMHKPGDFNNWRIPFALINHKKFQEIQREIDQFNRSESNLLI